MIDVNHNFYEDVKDIPKNKKHDPDSKSRELWNYHRLIWNKKVPDESLPDRNFKLDEHLHCKSFDIRFGVDCFLNLYLSHTKPIIKNIVDKAYENNPTERFQEPPYTIGASLIFPKNGTNSINSRRGCTFEIRDRIDLTLECIRRYYAKELPNPLSECLEANKNFFDLFLTFEQYIEFFLLQDFVSKDLKHVNFFLPFDNFQSDGYPKNVHEWKTLRDALTKLVKARNKRIDEYCRLNNI